MDEYQYIIEQKRELLERETYSRSIIHYSEDMSVSEKDRYIQYLVDRVNDADLDKRAILLVLDDFKEIQNKMQTQLESVMSSQSKLEAENSELNKKLKSAEARSRKLEEQLKYARKNRFGDKKQNTGKKSNPKDEADRDDEKDRFDGTDDTLSTESVDGKDNVSAIETSHKKERDLGNRPDSYSKMEVQGEPVVHPSDLSKVPGRILDRKPVKVFSFKMHLVEEHFEMVQYVENGKSPKWGYFPSNGHPEVVTKFKGTKASPEFLQALAYEVYVKNVTFGLLHRWLSDMGMTISKNTLRNWLKKGKTYLDKLIVVLKSIALEKDSIVNYDETWCKVRKYDHYRKCYIWVLVNKAEKISIFFYEDGSRGRDVLTNFLGDAELGSLMSDGYNAYVFIGNELKSAQFKDTEHQVCLAHLRAKLAKASEQGGDKTALVFSDDLDFFFRKEREYNKEGITPEERGSRRQSLEMKEVLIRLRSNLDVELGKDASRRSPYLGETLNYMRHFWNEAFAFLKNGNYPIDNNIAERSIRPLTTQRNSMLHFGSDEGVEMSAAYHSIISTVKMQGKSAWDYLGKFFKNIFNGRRDYVNLIPQNIELAYANGSIKH